MDSTPSTTHFSSISAEVDACDSRFKAVHNTASLLKDAMRHLPRVDVTLPDIGRITTEHERFMMWATNAGVFRQGRGSLDYRLRELPEEFGLMQMLLNNLYSTLNEYRTAADTARRAGWLDLGTEAGHGTHSAAVCDSSTEQDCSTTEFESLAAPVPAGERSDVANDPEAYPSTKPEPFDYVKALGSIHSTIDWLHRLSNLLRRAAVANQNLRARNYNILDLDEDGLKCDFEWLISRHFPYLSEQLKSRMASTMVERHRRMLYRRFYLKSGWRQQQLIMPDAGLKKGSAQSSQSQLNTTSASSKDKKGLSLSLFLAKTGTDPNPSLYHAYAASSISKVRSVTLNHTAEELLPPPPSACYTDLTFVCDYCYTILDSQVGRNSASWKKHMQQDLDPYVCLLSRCNLPHDIYSTSKEWLHHMREEHLVKWRCSATDHDVLDFGTREKLTKHITEAHPDKFDKELLHYVLEACRITSTVIFKSCPFCAESSNAIEEHVSHHLQYLALQSLPRAEFVDKFGTKNEVDDSSEVLSDESDERSRGSMDKSNAKLLDEGPQAMDRIHHAPSEALHRKHGEADALYQQEKYEKAEKVFRETAEGREKALGANHTDTLWNKQRLAGFLFRQGKYDEAKDIYAKALERKVKVLGPDHISTFDAVHSLGALYADQGRLDKAEAMYERALQGYEKALGLEHTSTLRTVNNLGTLYADQGRLDKAEAMYERALQGYEEALEPSVFKTYVPALITLENLGILYQQESKLTLARQYYLGARDGLRAVFGDDSERVRTISERLNEVSA